jgi:hypothetical protein
MQFCRRKTAAQIRYHGRFSGITRSTTSAILAAKFGQSSTCDLLPPKASTYYASRMTRKPAAARTTYTSGVIASDSRENDQQSFGFRTLPTTRF